MIEALPLAAKDVLWCCFGELKKAQQLLEEHRRRCVADGDLYRLAGSDGIIGVCKVLQGNIRDGIRLLEEAISETREGGLSGRCRLVPAFLMRGVFANYRGK